MSASSFVRTLHQVADDLRVESSRFRTIHAKAASALTALRDWSGPVGDELSTALEAQYRYLSQLPALLTADAQRVERIGGQLAMEFLESRQLRKPRLPVKSFVAALEAELQRAELTHAEAPDIGHPRPFQVSRTPTATAPLTSQLHETSQDLCGWANEIDLKMAGHLGVCFDDLYSSNFLPGVAMTEIAGALGGTLQGLSGALDVIVEIHRDCPLVKAQFQPRPTSRERRSELEFDLLILSPELALYRIPDAGGTECDTPDGEPLLIQTEVEEYSQR